MVHGISQIHANPSIIGMNGTEEKWNTKKHRSEVAPVFSPMAGKKVTLTDLSKR
jgi:hypothetical protein